MSVLNWCHQSVYSKGTIWGRASAHGIVPHCTQLVDIRLCPAIRKFFNLLATEFFF